MFLCSILIIVPAHIYSAQSQRYEPTNATVAAVEQAAVATASSDAAALRQAETANEVLRFIMILSVVLGNAFWKLQERRGTRTPPVKPTHGRDWYHYTFASAPFMAQGH